MQTKFYFQSFYFILFFHISLPFFGVLFQNNVFKKENFIINTCFKIMCLCHIIKIVTDDYDFKFVKIVIDYYGFRLKKVISDNEFNFFLND